MIAVCAINSPTPLRPTRLYQFSAPGRRRRPKSEPDWRYAHAGMGDLEVAPLSLHSDAMETFQAQLTRRLSDALSSAGLPFAGEVTPATDPRFGDYQSNAAMVLAKQRGENPRRLA